MFIKVLRIAYWLNLAAFVVLLLLITLRLGLLPQEFEIRDLWLGVGLSAVFFFPFLEVPMLIISGAGYLMDQRRRILYAVTSVAMLAGIVFAYINRNTPLP
ncbi:MAG: hypothetical protein HY851_05330 [candidate division Zixibacteria bacterium]|nr:hypothetical protein [candidate division Zixibacteria bacterium]